MENDTFPAHLAISAERVSKRFGSPSPHRRLFGRRRDVEDVLEPVGAAETGLGDDDEDEDEDETTEARPPGREIVALSDVSFHVARGRGLGIVGATGSGKSTLLRILARISPPTEGRIRIRGRVAPQLDTASSFMRRDLTVEQNLVLLGRFFGVPKELVDRQTPLILEFTGLGGRRDTKLERLPSGLIKRMSVGAVLHFEPDVLLADEQIVVGDSGFRERSLEALQAQVRTGLTLVLASNDLELIAELCDDLLWLHDGRVVSLGLTEDVLPRFEAARLEAARIEAAPIERAHARRPDRESRRPPEAHANETAAVIGGHIVDSEGEPLDAIPSGAEFGVRIVVSVRGEGASVRCGMALSAAKGVGIQCLQESALRCEAGSDYVFEVRIPAGTLADGFYELRAGAAVVGPGGQSDLVLQDPPTLAVGDADAAPAAIPSRAKLPLLTDLEWSVKPLDSRETTIH